MKNTLSNGRKKGVVEKLGDIVEKAGDKLNDAGFKKIGDAVEKAGDKIEHWNDSTNTQRRSK